MEVSFRLNGKQIAIEVSRDAKLLWLLRDELKLTGTKFGCGIAHCGVCTVHIDGLPTKSCLTLVSAIQDKSVTTIEGLSQNGNHPVQQAWIEEQVPQCGYCQSGQIMQAAALLEQNPDPSISEIQESMSAVLCRCGTYTRINKAIQTAAKL